MVIADIISFARSIADTIETSRQMADAIVKEFNQLMDSIKTQIL